MVLFQNNNRLTILMYHRVLSSPNLLHRSNPDEQMFNNHMKVLRRFFNVLPLSEGVKRLGDRTLPPRAVSITFDDGYADNYSTALPILKNWGLHATFFIATGFINGGIMWNDMVIETVAKLSGKILDLEEINLGVFKIDTIDERFKTVNTLLTKLKHLPGAERSRQVQSIVDITNTRLPDDLMMTEKQVYELRKSSMEIGGHTVSHPILTSIDNESASIEIHNCKKILENMIDNEVTLFAYPNGKFGRDYTSQHVEMVRNAGFKYAVATDTGVAKQENDVYMLPRIGPWDRRRLKYGLRLLKYNYF
jgi:peptidoglycan/xylan/chitin deacetylase (PgdA/CDA1 family)